MASPETMCAATMSKNSALGGSCVCESVQYVLTGDPVSLRVCHCINCQKASGSAFMALAWFQQTDVCIVRGQDKLRLYDDRDTDAGFPLQRQFCSDCGSNVFVKPGRETLASLLFVTMGTMDVDVAAKWGPKIEMFCHRKKHWVAVHTEAGSAIVATSVKVA